MKSFVWIFSLSKSSLQSFHCGHFICNIGTLYYSINFSPYLDKSWRSMLRCSHSWLVSLQYVSSVIFVVFFMNLPRCSLSPLTFVFFYTVFLSLSCPFCSYTTALPSGFSSFILISAGSLCCNPGGVSSGQSYPTSQYESGLQQRSQQGEQQGHQPRTLLHTSGWVAVADGTPRRAYQNRSTHLF